MDAALKELLVQTVTIEPWTGNNFDGSAKYGTAVSYAARVVGKALALRTAFSIDAGPGEMPDATFSIYLDATDATRISVRDRVTVPAAYRPDNRATVKIFTVSWFPDENGMYFVKLACGWMYHRQGSS